MNTQEYGRNYPFLINSVSNSRKIRQQARLAILTYNRIAIPLKLKPGSRVLDIGCCLGTTGHYLKYVGVKTIGIDINFEAIEQGRSIWGKEKCNQTFVAEGGRLPFPDRSFATVISQDVLEHISNETALERVFSEITRVLDGNKMFHKITTLDDKRNIHADDTHHIKWTESRWQRWFIGKGWQVINSPTKHFPGRNISYGNFLLTQSS